MATKKPLPPPPPAVKPPAGKPPAGKPQPSSSIGKIPSRPVLDPHHDGPEHRQFPRAQMTVPFRLWMGEGEELSFEATLRSGNVSVSGAFLASTFFLPVGTEVRCSFALDPEEEPVLARAQVIRVEQPNTRDDKARTGMALRFVEFFEQSEVTLARLFLGARLEAFAKEYLASKRARSLSSELDRCVDALAAWELQKVTATQSAWAEE